MDFLIKCDVFNRLISVTKHFKPTTKDRDVLSCIRLEYKSGHYYAIATNQEIAAIQYLGVTDQPDYAVHIINDETIIKQAESETPFDSFLFLQHLPEFEMITLTTTLGWQYQGSPCIHPVDTPLEKWREWFPDKVSEKNVGIMYWSADNVAALASSSTSGRLYFPEYIDVNQPMIIRDALDDNWCGLFIPKPDPTDPPVRRGAEKPLWV